ncbi:MAG: hypothetical protein DDT40_00918 [candidate division WS2 bacterium]|nr:hypothetical protein [Candidatus Psychracetigena formicireducens]
MAEAGAGGAGQGDRCPCGLRPEMEGANGAPDERAGGKAGAQRDASGVCAGAGAGGEEGDRRPGRGSPVQPGQREEARQAQGKRRSRACEVRAVHGDSGCRALQSGAAGVLPEAGRRGEGEEGRPHGMHASAHRHP